MTCIQERIDAAPDPGRWVLTGSQNLILLNAANPRSPPHVTDQIGQTHGIGQVPGHGPIQRGPELAGSELPSDTIAAFGFRSPGGCHNARREMSSRPITFSSACA